MDIGPERHDSGGVGGVGVNDGESSAAVSRAVTPKRVFFAALGGFRHATVRLVLSAVLTVFALVFFGYLLAYGAMDSLCVELDRAYEKGFETVVLCRKTYEKNNVRIGTVWGTDNATLRYDLYDSPLTPEQISALESRATVMPIVAQHEGLTDVGKHYADTSSASGKDHINVYYCCGAWPISRIVELGDTGEADACLQPDPRITVQCRLPRTYDEIAITDFYADMFMQFGYKDGDGQTYEIESPDAVIGKTINGLTVCGVYKTEEDKDAFRKKYDRRTRVKDGDLKTRAEMMADTDGFIYDYLQGEHPIRYAFVRSGFTAARTDLFAEPDAVQYEVLYKLSGNKKTDRDIFDSAARETRVDDSRVYSHFVDIKTRYSGFTRAARTSFIDSYQPTYHGWMRLCYYFAAAAAIAGAAVFMSFLLAARRAGESEMRALGAGKRATVLITALQCAVTAVAEFVVAISTVAIVCAAQNAKYCLPLFGISAGAGFAMLGLCLGAAAVAAVVPIIKTLAAKTDVHGAK